MEQEENRRKPTVRGIWEELLRLVYPPKCVFCGTLLEREEQDACKACLAELPWTDESSAVRTGRAFSRCVSPFFLTGKVHQALVDYNIINGNPMGSALAVGWAHAPAAAGQTPLIWSPGCR